MGGASLCTDSESLKGTKKKWTPLEDEALVSCMVDLFNTGTHNGESGFKSGYLGELEQLLKQKIPSSGIKARPHIESRLKTLKKEWGIVFDMVYGPHSSKFRWDCKRNMVIAKSVDWDAYLTASLSNRQNHVPFYFFSLLFLIVSAFFYFQTDPQRCHSF